MKCDDCKQDKEDVEETTCPYAEELHNEIIEINLCEDCYCERCLAV